MKRRFSHSVRDTLIVGAPKAKLAGTLAACSVLLAGHIEDSDGISPLNAVSHIVWGDEAYKQSQPSLKYTGTALLLNEVSIAGWAYLHEWLFAKSRREGRGDICALGAVGVSLLAYIIDYHAVPERFKPGFERHLQPKSLLLIYSFLALSLMAGDLIIGRKR